MPELKVENREYQKRIEAAIFKAVMGVSLDKETNTASLMSGEIVEACINMIAMMAGTSEATSSPTQTRQFTDEIAKTLRLRIAEVRRKRAAGEMDFVTVVGAGDLH